MSQESDWSDSSSSIEDVRTIVSGVCLMCQYYEEGQDFAAGIQPALPETYCNHCGIRLCQKHLNEIYSPEEWQTVLNFGEPKQSITTECAECSQEFCKYRLFEDKHQNWECYRDGPHGRSILGETCLQQAGAERDYTGSFICELINCKGTAFCSLQCKQSHVRECKQCREDFHVHSISKKYCRPCCREIMDEEVEEERHRTTGSTEIKSTF